MPDCRMLQAIFCHCELLRFPLCLWGVGVGQCRSVRWAVVYRIVVVIVHNDGK